MSLNNIATIHWTILMKSIFFTDIPLMCSASILNYHEDWSKQAEEEQLGSGESYWLIALLMFVYSHEFILLIFWQPADCKILIERLKSCSEDELLVELKKIETWTYGKCELYHWVDVLDLCDTILERACRKEHENSWVLACDLPQNKQVYKSISWP